MYIFPRKVYHKGYRKRSFKVTPVLCVVVFMVWIDALYEPKMIILMEFLHMTDP